MYYADKLDTLKDIFGSEKLRLEHDRLVVDDRVYPIIDDVIILLDPSQYPSAARTSTTGAKNPSDFAEDIQFTFGEEWQKFPDIMAEHQEEFQQYFDLIDLPELTNSRVCDLGCGIGRWSHFLKDICRELILIDFSEAIFVARRNLKDASNALFFMGDIKRLPFRNKFADFLYCLGVLHHLPTDALDEVRRLKSYAPSILIYLYYGLDNRPFYFRGMLAMVTIARLLFSRIRSQVYRSSFTWLCAVAIYRPLILIGKVLAPFDLAQYVPLYDGYNKKCLQRIRQDVYDRFFTRIEQRFSRNEILMLTDTFRHVVVSDHMPYWHFICRG